MGMGGGNREAPGEGGEGCVGGGQGEEDGEKGGEGGGGGINGFLRGQLGEPSIALRGFWEREMSREGLGGWRAIGT